MCTATYCYVLQFEMHVRLICAVKFYLLTYLLTYSERIQQLANRATETNMPHKERKCAENYSLRNDTIKLFV